MITTIPPSARILMAGLVDYAGLFPPAALSMTDAVAEFQACRDSEDRWALGRFVVPASRLDECGTVATTAGLLPAGAAALVGIAALAGEELDQALDQITAFNRAFGERGAAVQSVECRASNAEAVRAAANRFAKHWECWVEIPLDGPLPDLLDAIAAAQVRPKIRMGGVEPGAFPDPDRVVEFLTEVVARGMPFKATAGLHHPLRGTYRYTYASDSASGLMYGYLNLLLATALLQAGGDAVDARALLLEDDPAAVVFEAAGVSWQQRCIPLAGLQHVRDHGMRAFGSCSFREPLSDLSQLMVP